MTMTTIKSSHDSWKTVSVTNLISWDKFNFYNFDFSSLRHQQDWNAYSFGDLCHDGVRTGTRDWQVSPGLVIVILNGWKHVRVDFKCRYVILNKCKLVSSRKSATISGWTTMTRSLATSSTTSGFTPTVERPTRRPLRQQVKFWPQQYKELPRMSIKVCQWQLTETKWVECLTFCLLLLIGETNHSVLL